MTTAKASAEINGGITPENGSLVGDMKAGDMAVNGDHRTADLDLDLDLGSAPVNVDSEVRSGGVGKGEEEEEAKLEGEGEGDPEGAEGAVGSTGEIEVENGVSGQEGGELGGEEEENGHGGSPESNVIEVENGVSGQEGGELGGEEEENVHGGSPESNVIEVENGVSGQEGGELGGEEEESVRGGSPESNMIEVENGVSGQEGGELGGEEEENGHGGSPESNVGADPEHAIEEEDQKCSQIVDGESGERVVLELVANGVEKKSEEREDGTGEEDGSMVTMEGMEEVGDVEGEAGDEVLVQKVVELVNAEIYSQIDRETRGEINGKREDVEVEAPAEPLEAEVVDGSLEVEFEEQVAIAEPSAEHETAEEVDSRLDGRSEADDHAVKEASLEAGDEVCAKEVNLEVGEVCGESDADPVKANGLSHGEHGEAPSHTEDLALEAEVEDSSLESIESIKDEQSQTPKKEDHGQPKSEANEAVEVIESPIESGEKTVVQVVKGPVFIVKIPRLTDEERQRDIQLTQSDLDEKTRIRDSKRDASQAQRVVVQKLREEFDLAKKEEEVARHALAAKRQEMDAVQSVVGKMKSATNISQANDQIRSLEHRMQHETITLKEEKECLNEIKKWKQHRDELSSNICSQTELQEAFEQSDQIGERSKGLKKDLDSLKADVARAEGKRRAAHKTYVEERTLQDDLKKQFEEANRIRQEAYVKWTNLKRELNQKTEVFYKYKNDKSTAIQLVSSGNREGLQSHCFAQIESIMTLWNSDDEFRKLYVKSNVVSTVRRLKTLDGRSLGPDEEPVDIQSLMNKNSNGNALQSEIRKTMAPVVPEKEQDLDQAAAAVQKDILADSKVVQPKGSATVKKSLKPTARETRIAMILDREEIEEVKEAAEEEKKMTKEEEDLAKREEDLRKEKAAAELKERCRLEQKAKFMEAEERKRRKSEKTQARAELKAQREAELKEKKKAKKKEKKAVGADQTSETIEENPGDSTTETAQEPETIAAAPSRRSSKPPSVKKIQPLPLPLRNRGRRRMTTWMWVLLTLTVVFALFFGGNYVYA